MTQISNFQFLMFRAKWYKAVHEKKYKPAAKDESKRNTLEVLRSQNHELKAVLAKMEEEFPYLRHNLKKVNALLPLATV